jgi:opacity protein-like surface antigen
MPTQRARLLLVSILLAGIAALCSPASAHAQRRTDVNANGWYTFNGDHRLSDSWGAHTEFQWRRHNIITDPQQLIMRLGANYYAGKQVMFTTGYGLIESYSGGQYFPEQRLYEQVQLSEPMGRLVLTHRYRLEQRWDKLAGTSSYLYLNRMRYMLRGTVPLKGRTVQPREPYFSAYDEIFVGFGNNVPNVFDQNRASAGLGYKLSREAAVEADYMYQITQQRNRTVFQHNHTLVIGLQYNFDFRQSSRRH